MDEQSLREWYDEYLAYDADRPPRPLIQAVFDDDLDMSSIEGRIQDAMQSINVERGFCDQCQRLMDNWPLDYYSDLENESVPKDDSEQGNSQAGDEAREETEESEPEESDEDEGEPEPRWKTEVARSSNTVDIEASARRGCKFCAYLLQKLKDQDTLMIYRQIESRLEELGEPSTVSLSIGTMWTGGSFNLWLDLPNKISTECNSEAARMKFRGTSRTIDRSVNFADKTLGLFDQANEWLRACSASHESCNAIAEGFLPTRLISLVGGQPRLIITDDMEPTSSPVRYAALSYCWGTNPFIKLETDNIDTFKKGIPTENIPKTFADAFDIASRLAIDFIWIDSLCIVQNDQSDWEKESEKMQQVYSSAHVCVSASSAEKVDQGCFQTPEFFCDGFVAKARIDGRQELIVFDDYNLYKRSVLDTHLMTRAWAIQEKVLSPRTLHFGDRGILWECKKGFASEWLPKPLRQEHRGLLGDRDIANPRWWLEIVKAYSAANLTYPHDKLRALAGIARAVFKQTGDDYLSGIWRKDIELHLCWIALGPRITQKRVDLEDRNCIAPTWSWASIDGGVTYVDSDHRWDDEPEGERYGHVFDMTINRSETQDFGQSNRRVLHMRCCGLVPGRLCGREIPPSPDPDPYETTDSVSFNYQNHEKVFPIYVDCISDSRDLQGELVYLLPLVGGSTGGGIKEDKGEWVDEKSLSGLVLRKTSESCGEFDRIGSFRFYENQLTFGGSADKSREPFLEIFNEVGAAAETVCAEMVCNPEYPKEKYVITIV